MVAVKIKTHGDDDGMRAPPRIAPRQIVIVPMLRDKPEDADLLAYCRSLAKELAGKRAFEDRLRAHVDEKLGRPAEKRWDWVRRGAPIVCEIGPRDAANGQVTYFRRDRLREGERIRSVTTPRADFVRTASATLVDIQKALTKEARARLDGNIRTDIKSFKALADYFGTDDESGEFKGWIRAPWSRPTGAALEAVEARLKPLKLTFRNAPMRQKRRIGRCLFSGAPGVEEIIIARAY